MEVSIFLGRSRKSFLSCEWFLKLIGRILPLTGQSMAYHRKNFRLLPRILTLIQGKKQD